MAAPRPKTPSYDPGADSTFAADAPSVHGQLPEPEPEPEQEPAQPPSQPPSPERWDPSRDDLPHINKRGMSFGDERVAFKSPRCAQALRETGVRPKDLQPKRIEDFAVGAKIPEVVEKRFQAFEEVRARPGTPPM